MRIKCRTSTTIVKRYRVQPMEALLIVGGTGFSERLCELTGVSERRGVKRGQGQGTQTVHPLP
jgi:hypothetical protein